MMTKFFRLFFIVGLFNTLGILAVESFSHNLFGLYVDNEAEKILHKKESIYQDITKFKSKKWERLAIQLSEKFNVNAMVVPSVGKNIIEPNTSNIEKFSQKLNFPDDYTLPLEFPLDDFYTLQIEQKISWFILDTVVSWVYILAAIGITFCILFFEIVKQTRVTADIRRTLGDLLGIAENGRQSDLSLLTSELKLHFSEKEKEQLLTIADQRELFHGVAHEFRSPLAKIQFALDLLQDESSEGREQLVDKINKYIDDLDHLIKELLFYSQVNIDNTKFDISTFDIYELVNTALEAVEPFYPNVQFSNQVEEVKVNGDENLLLRLLTNLVRNAGRFANSVCEIRSECKNKNFFLSVEDDGPGIAIDKRKVIFTPFSRLDNSRSRDSGGCGLGLAIAASIARKHDSDIVVESSDLGGAKFIVNLSIAKG